MVLDPQQNLAITEHVMFLTHYVKNKIFKKKISSLINNISDLTTSSAAPFLAE